MKQSDHCLLNTSLDMNSSFLSQKLRKDKKITRQENQESSLKKTIGAENQIIEEDDYQLFQTSQK